MECILVAGFRVESEAYQAMTEVRQSAITTGYVFSQACLVKNEGGHIVVKDQFDTGVETTDDTRNGGLVGGLIGIIGGPIGMLVGGSMGALIGNVVDSSDSAKNASMIEKVCSALPVGSTAIIALLSEVEPHEADRCFMKYDSELVRFDAAEVAEEIEEAERLQKQMERETRARLREEKKEERRQKIEDKRAKMKADFEKIKSKLARK